MATPKISDICDRCDPKQAAAVPYKKLPLSHTDCHLHCLHTYLGTTYLLTYLSACRLDRRLLN
eukprot:scaffold5591_cov148-Skeletonema_marinoi.AAC.1